MNIPGWRIVMYIISSLKFGSESSKHILYVLRLICVRSERKPRGKEEGKQKPYLGCRYFLSWHFCDNTDTIMTLFNIEMISWNSFRDSHLPLWASCPCSLSPPATHQQWIFLWNMIINLREVIKKKTVMKRSGWPIGFMIIYDLKLILPKEYFLTTENSFGGS